MEGVQVGWLGDMRGFRAQCPRSAAFVAARHSRRAAGGWRPPCEGHQTRPPVVAAGLRKPGFVPRFCIQCYRLALLSQTTTKQKPLPEQTQDLPAIMSLTISKFHPNNFQLHALSYHQVTLTMR